MRKVKVHASKVVFSLFLLFCVSTNLFAIDSTELIKKAKNTFSARKYDGSRPIFIEALELAKKENNKINISECYGMIARTYSITKKLPQARQWIKKAKRSTSPKAPKGWSRYLLERGRIEREEGKKKQATNTFIKAYEFCSKHKLHNRAVDAAHMVGIAGTPEQQIEWSLKAIREAEAGKMTGWLAVGWNNLGATYEDLKRYKECLDAYLKAREYHWRVGREKNKLAADWAVGRAYRYLGKNKKAASWLRPSLAWSERLQDKEWIGFCCYELGFVHAAEGRNRSARVYLERAMKLLKSVGILNWGKWGKDQYAALEAEHSKVVNRLK